MPKNTKGGKHFKKGKRSEIVGAGDKVERPLPLKDVEMGQEYGYVTKLLGSCRVMVSLLDQNNSQMNCNIMKSFKREKMFVNVDSLVLVGTRPDMTGRGKGDILYLYDKGEESKLMKQGHIPQRVIPEDDEDDLIVRFAEEIDVDEEIDLETL